MCLFQTRTYAQLLRMRACCKYFKQEGQKVWKNHKIPNDLARRITFFLI